MFAEYAEVFDRLRHRYPEKPHVDWVSALRDDAELIFPAIRLPEVFIDPDVIQFAECAVAGEAGILVSGDKAHVQKAGSIRGILVVAPARFLELMG